MMGSLFVSLILSMVVFAHGKRVLINEIVDNKLILNNLRAAESGKTTLDLGAGFMNPVSFEGAVAIGLDSLHRTGSCSMEFSDNSITYNYEVGQAIHAVYFRKLNSPYGEGSGYYRAFSNSITYGYTVSYDRKCQVTIDKLAMTLANVELCVKSNCLSSATDAGFANIVAQQLTPGLNKMLSANSQKLQESLNRIYCQTNELFATEDQIGKGLYALNESLFE